MADAISERGAQPDWLARFEAGGRVYALDVRQIREIIRGRELLPLPGAPSLIEGVAELRGVVLPVVDLGRVLGGEPVPASPAARIAIVQLGELVFGLRVAAAYDVVPLDPAARDRSPLLTSRAGDALVHAVARRPGSPPDLVLSLEQLVERVYGSAGSPEVQS
ncbi:MAG: chemotaxis protein CheW [Deltaproteobacteria bacterium]|nr:MAG: chemotaxis protein CheW [Deltaproteobacteria bacterium]